LKNVKVIDCNHETALNAISSQLTDIEDALQYYTAINHKVDYFISLDKQFIKSALPVLPIYTPQEFLKEFDF
jgi:predicted nucleic acid-binding protein